MHGRYVAILMAASLARMAAQTNTAAISGSVADQGRGVLRGVAVTLTQQSTGAQRSTHTDDSGAYYFLQLPPGPYRIAASLEGFRTEVREGIELSVGSEIHLDLALALGAMTQETVVAADASPLQMESAALSGAMDGRSIRELPLNGRDFAQLALLEPGVAPSRRTSDSGGPGTKLVAGGSRPSQISFLLDGADINDSNNNTPGSAAGVLLGVDALQEFRVYTNAYAAQYGRSGGAVVSAVTRAGTNDFHGALFEFTRNSRFDAKNFFDPLNQPIPAFRRNQFGMEMDGPIERGRTFFLVSMEGLRQSLGATHRSVTPDEASRQGSVPGLAPIRVAAGVAPYLALIPLPNGRSFGDGTGEFIYTATQPVRENFFAGRIDHSFSERTSVFARYSRDSAASQAPDDLNLFSATSSSLNDYSAVQVTRIISERSLNDLRVAYNRSESATGSSPLRSVPPALSFVNGEPMGQISVTGLFSLGPSRFSPSFSTMHLYQAGDDFSWAHGRHAIRFGADQKYVRLPTMRPQSPYGYYQFSSLSGFLQGQAAAVEYTTGDSATRRDWRQSMSALYIQDDWQLGHRATLNFGLRYERVSSPGEAHGMLANLRDPLHDPAPTAGGPLFVNPTDLNFAPRAGLSWDPAGSGKMVLRAGFGVFYDPLWTDFYANAGNREPPYYTLGSVRNPVFPLLDPSRGAAGFVLGRLDALQYRPQSPYTMQYNFSIQRALWGKSSLTVSYAGKRGLHLPRLIDQNQAVPQILPDGRPYFPPGSVERNPHFTGIRYKVTDGTSWYNALQAAFEHRFGGGLGVRANYSWSKSIDDGSITLTQGGDNDMPQNPNSRKAERGLSNYDLRHNLVASITWDVPARKALGWMGRGWQMNAIAEASSGNPFSALVGFDRAGARFEAGTSPQRPDLAPGASGNPILGGPDRYFDPAAFTLPQAGFFGNLGRNTLTGPGLANLDSALNKRFRLTERVRAQFRAELFNLLNHPNFAIPSQRTVFSAAGPVGSAGRITSTSTASRQVQFGIKVTF